MSTSLGQSSPTLARPRSVSFSSDLPMPSRSDALLQEREQVPCAEENDVENWRFHQEICGIPSGKPTENYGKSPLFMGKSTITGHFQ